MPDTKTDSKTKTLLTMTRYSVAANGALSMDKSKLFSVMINPAEITLQRSIGYSRVKTLGQTRSEMKFSAFDPDKVGFSIVLDGTIAAPRATSGTAAKDVKEQMSDLLAVVYDYVGKQHEPSRVRLLWGTVILFGRLSSMSTQYTLFKPSGDPLRAKVELKFAGAMSKSEEQLTANRSSPDLSHIVVSRRETRCRCCATRFTAIRPTTRRSRGSTIWCSFAT